MTSSSSRRPGAPRRSATRSSGCCRRRRTSGRCTTSRPDARWPTCSSSGSTSTRASARRWPSPSSAGTAKASPPTPVARRSRSRCALCTSATTWRRSAGSSRPARALDAARDRRDRTYDPALADLFVQHGHGWFERLRDDRAVGCGAGARARATPCADGRALDDALTVAADFIDLKSPYMVGHSRRCADLAADAARVLGFPDEAITRLSRGGARARLRHHRGPELDLGQARAADADGVRPRRASPDADRADAAPLAGTCRAEPGRVARTTRSATGPDTTSACSADPGDLDACVLAATEIYVGMTTERADRPRILARGRSSRASAARVRRRDRRSREPRRARRFGAR